MFCTWFVGSSPPASSPPPRKPSPPSEVDLYFKKLTEKLETIFQPSFPRKGRNDAAMVVLKRLGRDTEAAQLQTSNLANQEPKQISDRKTLEPSKTGFLTGLFQSWKQGNKQKDNKKYPSRKLELSNNTLNEKLPYKDHRYDATEKTRTKKEPTRRYKRKENLSLISSPSTVPHRKTGLVHFAGHNKVFAATQHCEGGKEAQPLKDQRFLSTLSQSWAWLRKLREEGNLKEQLCGISKAIVLVFLHEWGGSSVLLQHSILILIQGGIPEADVFNLNLILGGAILATSTTGGFLHSRGSPSCRRVLLLATTAVTVASLALLSLSLALRCPGQQLLDFSVATTSNDEESAECPTHLFFCEPLNECLNAQSYHLYNNTNICDSTTSTTTTSPQSSSSTCKDYEFPNELVLLAAVLATQHLGLNVCIFQKYVWFPWISPNLFPLSSIWFGLWQTPLHHRLGKPAAGQKGGCLAFTTII